MAKAKASSGNICVVDEIPKCDFCDMPGHWDFGTKFGPWAHGCNKHFVEHRRASGTGVGKAQLWVTDDDQADGRFCCEVVISDGVVTEVAPEMFDLLGDAQAFAKKKVDNHEAQSVEIWHDGTATLLQVFGARVYV